MTKYHAEIKIRLRRSILDPKGKASKHALDNLGFDQIEEVRIGKLIDVTLEANTTEEAEKVARKACDKLLANEVMEDYEVSVQSLKRATA